MEWVLWMIAVAVLGLGAVAATGRLGSMPGTVTDTPRAQLPVGILDSKALREARFAVVTRGYSMDQVDELLDRLAEQLQAAESAEPGGRGSDSSSNEGLSPKTLPGLE
ncbi:MAG: DivIVA domain-containing protein [Micropruina sp.]|nr:DivIVA domain-containing protein [Micropruina sp.]